MILFSVLWNSDFLNRALNPLAEGESRKKENVPKVSLNAMIESLKPSGRWIEWAKLTKTFTRKSMTCLIYGRCKNTA